MIDLFWLYDFHIFGNYEAKWSTEIIFFIQILPSFMYESKTVAPVTSFFKEKQTNTYFNE